VTWETPPQVPGTAVEMTRELDLELDDLAGQQNYGNVETNNALGKTLGGLKLAAGAANAVQEFDIRVWIETWATKCLQQIVRLEQYYESDPTVLGLCGAKAQLWKKFGINKIDDELMEQDVTVRVSVGLGAGDPQQRLAKFETFSNIIAPILQQSPDFQSGKRQINVEAIIEEVFGACGYKDGGARFFQDGEPKGQDPMLPLRIEELKAKIAKDERTGKAAFFTGISNLAKVALGKRELESDVVDMLLTHQSNAHTKGFEHGHRHMDQHLKRARPRPPPRSRACQSPPPGRTGFAQRGTRRCATRRWRCGEWRRCGHAPPARSRPQCSPAGAAIRISTPPTARRRHGAGVDAAPGQRRDRIHPRQGRPHRRHAAQGCQG
jgi:hypothetical protein